MKKTLAIFASSFATVVIVVALSLMLKVKRKKYMNTDVA
jgi:hypothetical protein